MGRVGALEGAVPDVDAAQIPLADHVAIVDSYQAQLDELAPYLREPHRIALARGDLYLYARDLETFRAPLAWLLYNVIPTMAGSSSPAEVGVSAQAEPKPASPPAGAPPPPQSAALVETVAAVLGILAAQGLLQMPGTARPPLPTELAPPMPEVPTPLATPVRPAVQGPRAGIKNALLGMLDRY